MKAKQTNQRNKKKTTKKSARRRESFFAIHYKQAKEALLHLLQRPMGNILTIAVISMALSMPACLYLLSKNIVSVAGHVEQGSQISLYVKEGTPEARIMVLKDGLESRADVASVKYISSQQGLDELSEQAGFAQAISALEDYALPGVLEVLPKETSQQAVKQLAQALKSEADVTDVRLDEDWLSRMDALKNLALLVASSLSVLMFCAVFLIVGNTLRFNVLENKAEIQTMKLIGATDTFILRPYLYSGMWFGLIGAVIAWILTALMTIILNHAVAQLAALYDSQFRLMGLSWDETLLLLMIGIFIGSLAAKLSAKRHLNEIEPV